ncbi:GNAT family N-acetyltransferase [Sphingomonas taxi]|uniref:GNAT family N-acetyltransferase n=1 Tax=Sphingomonas taxi TaxID=1549858 RepID=UPI0009DFFF30|nr:GNAT family N-acetyltransferase [Sphingomonas taxi]
MSTAPATLHAGAAAAPPGFEQDRIVPSSPRDPLARPLLEGLLGEYDRRYGDLPDHAGAAEQEVYHRYPAEAFEPPHGAFLLLLRDGEPIAGGGFMRHADPLTAELKRIWTADRHRRQGLAIRIVAALEAEATRLGYTRVFLTTGFRQPEAAALYHRLGYSPLYDPQADLAALFKLPFEKGLAKTVRDA